MRFELGSVKHITILQQTRGAAHCNMKFFICALAFVAVASAAPQGYTKEGLARIVQYNQDQREDGSYSYNIETENGIKSGETNVPKPAAPNGEPAPNVEGGYSFTHPDGTPFALTYRAGEEGYIAESASIPIAPPIPEEILRGLAWNAAHPEEEAYWDGVYSGKAVPQPAIYNQGR